LIKPGIYLNVDTNICSAIFRNIISNAIKFTKKGHIEVDAIKMDDFYLITITDNGIGMNQQTIDNLFTNPSSRVGLSGEKGTGLGLNIAYESIKIMEGNIKVESVENKGTTFYISLPAYKD
jgi:signal transduction histidine kinase